jgi:hypothetical protein
MRCGVCYLYELELYVKQTFGKTGNILTFDKNPYFNVLKRFVSILLIPAMLICTSGGTMYREQCAMSRIAAYSLIPGKLCCCSKTAHNKCCHESKLVIKKIEDNYNASVSAGIPSIKLQRISFLPFSSGSLVCGLAIPGYAPVFAHSPPDNRCAFLSVRYCSLLL